MFRRTLERARAPSRDLEEVFDRRPPCLIQGFDVGDSARVLSYVLVGMPWRAVEAHGT